MLLISVKKHRSPLNNQDFSDFYLMKKLLVISTIIGAFFSTAAAQSEQNVHPAGKSNIISAGIHIPIGEFSSTHDIGLGIEYSWSHHRFGRINEIPLNSIGFATNIGANYYFGKKEMIGVYPFEYSDYTFLHMHGGIIYNPGKKANISLTAGPALGIYSSHTQFNIGANLKGSYYVNKNIAIAPVITIMKESKSDPLWAMAIQAGFSF